MAKRIRKSERPHEDGRVALGELIHAQVRGAIETAVQEELAIALGAERYERQAAWTTRALTDVDLVYVYLDAVCLRVRQAGKVTSVPVLTAVAVLADGRKELLALELCGSESGDAWKGFVDDLKARGLRAPLLA